MQIKLPFESHS